MKKKIPKIMETDFEVHYTVNKQSSYLPADIKNTVLHIVNHVQNHSIYFRYDPVFHNGILIFALIGYPHDLEKFQESVEPLIEKCNCKLGWSALQSLDNGEPE